VTGILHLHINICAAHDLLFHSSLCETWEGMKGLLGSIAKCPICVGTDADLAIIIEAAQALETGFVKQEQIDKARAAIREGVESP